MMDQTHLFAPMEQRQTSSFHTGNHRFGLSSRTSDSSHMEERPQLMNSHVHGVEGLSVSNIGAENFERNGDCQPTRSSTSGVNSVSNQAPLSLLGWYRSQNDPWAPLVVDKNTSQSRHEDLRDRTEYMPSSKNHGPQFQGYRGSTVPSECDTIHTGVLPSDSGYASAPRPSIGQPSVFEDMDRNTETQSIIGQFSDVQLTNAGDMWNPPAEIQTTVGTVAHDKDNLICPWCKNKVKTKSELNKHRQRHTKPYHCQEEGCNRKEGFSTQNDLDRHIRSRHPRATPTGSRYMCRIGTCRTKQKIWPRADNFRQHLKRVHKVDVSADDDLDQYIYRESSVCPVDFVGMGSSVASYSMGAVSDSHNLPSPSILLDPTPRPGLSPQMPGFDNSYGSDYIGNSINYQEPSNYNNDPHFSMMSSSNTPDCHREQSLDSLSRHIDMFGDSEDQAELPEEPRIIEPARRDRTYIQTDPFEHRSIAAEDRDEGSMETMRTRDPEYEVFRKDDDKAEVTTETAPHSEAHPHTRDISTTGTSSDDAITIDDRDAPADDLSPESPTAASDFKPEVTERKLNNSSPSKPESDAGAGEPMDVDENSAVAILNSLHKKGVLAALVGNLGFQMAAKPSTKSKKSTAAQVPAQESNSVTCSTSGCNKSFSRPCELKKHMKRHEKPYGCTFPNCSKRFGSKNDWKRHENSQHLSLEMWRCNEKMRGNPDGICGKVCHRRETFKYHLQKDHAIDNTSIIEQKWEVCRVGRNCETRFWCGFCKKIIEINQKGAEAWTERFDHIDNHYAGRNGYDKMDISQWQPVDPDLPGRVDTPTSDEEGEPSSSKLTTPATARLPPTNPKEVSRTSRKRKASDDDRPSKIQRTNTRARDYFWYCCKCGEVVGNVSLFAACMNADCYQHDRCEDCSVELVERVS